MFIAKAPSNRGGLRRLKVLEDFINFSSACLVRCNEEGFEVIRYDLMGYKEPHNKHFKSIREMERYLEMRRTRLKNNSLWRKKSIYREERMQLDFDIRQRYEKEMGKMVKLIEWKCPSK